VALTKPSVVAISPDGSRVYAGLRNGYLQVLDASTFQSLTSIDTGVSPMSMVISRDGRKLFVASSGGDADAVLATVDVTTGQVSNTVLSGVKGTIELVMSADGDRLFVEATDAVIETDPQDGSITARMPMEFAEIAPVSGDRMLAVNYDNALSLLDRDGTTTALPRLRGPAAMVEDLEGISDGSRAYLLREATSAAGGSRLDVLVPATGNTTTQLFVPGGQLSAEELRMSPDGRLSVVIPFNDKSIILVDIPTP
jgi:DNA-binding beta-propeller fold protein YncE